jgi:hypothetical protein
LASQQPVLKKRPPQFTNRGGLGKLFTTNGSGDDRNATNSDDDGDDGNTRSSELSNENRSR